MTHNQIVLVVALAIVNGLFTPFNGLFDPIARFWYPIFLPEMRELVDNFRYLILQTLTLMVAGVPAALYERVAGGGTSSFTSGLIWLAGVLLLSFPAVPNILKALGFGG